MKNSLNVIMSILILLVLAAGVYFIVQTVRESAQAAAAPFQGVEQANQALQTQVSQLINPTPMIIPDPVTYINEIRALARLETIQYSVEKVVTVEVGQGVYGFAFGDKVLFVGHGTVNPGIKQSVFAFGQGQGHSRTREFCLSVQFLDTHCFQVSLDLVQGISPLRTNYQTV